jgi:sugar (pentulose or hexulose) kinase
MLLGLDLGTTNIKALITEENGHVVSSGSAPVQIEFTEDGGAEQNIEDIWHATLTAVSQAVAATDGSRVEAIGISAQGGAMQILDPSGHPFGRVIGWQDARGLPWDERVERQKGRQWLIDHIGISRSAEAIGQILRLRELDALPARFRIGFVGDMIVGRLCGRQAHDPSSLSIACLLNPHMGTEDPEVLEMLGLDRSQLPALLDVGEPAGSLLAEPARRMGLRPGIPVGPAVHDQYASAVGCGAVNDGDMMLGTGTAWVLLSVTARQVAATAELTLLGRHPVAGLFGRMLSMVNGGSCLSWTLQTLGLGSLGVREVDQLLFAVPPGSGGVRIRPLLITWGPLFPPGTAGRIDGLRLDHTREHIVRAMVEGLACELGRYIRILLEKGVKVGKLLMCGGSAASEVTPHIISDTTGFPIECAAVSETSSLGAAMFARKLREPKRGLAELSSEMKPQIRSIVPSANAGEYTQMLKQYIASLPPLPA